MELQTPTSRIFQSPRLNQEHILLLVYVQSDYQDNFFLLVCYTCFQKTNLQSYHILYKRFFFQRSPYPKKRKLY